MNKLKTLLANRPERNFAGWFQTIAELLFGNYVIKTAIGTYQLTEIEFYYYNKDHYDESTYGFIKEGNKYTERILKHKQCQQKTSTWFFHYSGIDIVIGKENEPGGILIRSVRNITTGENIKGPLVVYLELLNQNINIDGSNTFKLELMETEAPMEFTLLEPSVRKGIGDNSKEYKEAKYNFSIK